MAIDVKVSSLVAVDEQLYGSTCNGHRRTKLDRGRGWEDLSLRPVVIGGEKVLSETTSPLSFILATSSSSVSLRGIRKDNRDLPGHMT